MLAVATSSPPHKLYSIEETEKVDAREEKGSTREAIGSARAR